MDATITGKCDVVAELISLGADVDIQTNLVSHFLISHHDTTNYSGLSPKCVLVY